MATTSLADYMARVTASMFHAALINAAAEKAAAAAHHQQQQSQQQNRAIGASAAACASPPPLVPFFPLPLLALPPGTVHLQPQQQPQQNGGTATNEGENAKAAEGQKQKKKQNEEEEKATQGNSDNKHSNGRTTKTAKAKRNGGGGATTKTTFSSSGDNGGGQHSDKTKQKQQQQQRQPQQRTINDGPKKGKRPCPSSAPAEESPKQQHQQQVVAKAEPPQSSESPLSTSRISSPDSVVHRNGSGRGARKLKLYVAEEKVDIIDYAKCIGNRAAGREFNVAESSIREWRKNEEKIRRQAESTLGCTQHFEQSQPDILAWVDDQLVKAVIGEKGEQCTTTDWYTIGARARQLWAEKAESSEHLDGSEMKITMGWVSRFMRRNEHRVPKIAPPIIATGNAPSSNSAVATPCCSVSGGGGGPSASAGVSMVKSNSIGTTDASNAKQRPKQQKKGEEEEEKVRTKARHKRPGGTTAKGAATAAAVDDDDEHRPPLKKAKTANGTERAKATPEAKPTLDSASPASSSPVAAHNQQANSVPTSARRRKCLKPMRVDATCATLLTTSGPTGIDQSEGVSS